MAAPLSPARRSVVLVALGIACGAVVALAMRPGRSPTSTATPLQAQGQEAPRAGPAVGGPAIPRFASPAADRVLPESRPGAPGYNPAAFVGVRSLSAFFAQEPRVERWAGPLERYLTERIGKEIPALVPGVALKSTECRTATCRVEFERTNPGASVDRHRLQQLLALLYSPGAGAGAAHAELGFVLVFRGPSWFAGVPGDDPRALFAAIEKRRAAALAETRARHAAGKAIAFNAIDPTALPVR